MGEGFLVAWIDAAAREATLFAAIWFLVGGLDDLAVDCAWLLRRARQMVRHLLGLAEPLRLEAPVPPGRIAVFVGAWDESAVIGAMLRTALDRFDHGDYRIYVGAYPNDRATVDAAAEVAEADPRVRLVIGSAPGPTTKADCLNGLWRALLRDEAEEDVEALAVVLHDAEDLVHPQELRIFAQQLVRFDAVQLPVLPLRVPGSRFVSGHYLDEFAEAHGKSLPVRQALGAGLPFAGVGCAIRRGMLARIAEARGGAPFDAASLTEDYELGLTVAAMGGRATLARVPEGPGGMPVAVRAYFPDTIASAVRQKARWMVGIALAGWDRTGWGPARNLGDHWMRMRDRRATLAMPVLAIAYAALLLWGLSFVWHGLARSSAAPMSDALGWLLLANVVLLAWRIGMRAGFVGAAYGWREAVLSVPRIFVANIIALLAARRAAMLYLGMLRGSPLRWDKTAHRFPEAAA